jgi:4-carboxymuconolactone decarboxylase
MAEEMIETSGLPRVRPVTYRDADPHARAVFDDLQHPAAADPFFGTLMQSPDYMQVHAPYVRYIKDSPFVPLRQKEIAILRSAWNCGTDYQWAMHTKAGLAAGLTQEEIDHIPEGPDWSGWSDEDRSLLRAVDELHSSCRITDATWAGLAAQYDDRQLVELLVLLGFYRTVSYVMNGVGLPPPGGSSPDLPGNRFLFAPTTPAP